MGRHAGWIAAYSGIAGGAAEILVPKFRLTSTRYVPACATGMPEASSRRSSSCQKERSRRSGLTLRRHVSRPRPTPWTPSGTPRLGGIGDWLAREIEVRTGFEARTTILGHVQRGGSPTARDRVLATRFGSAAVAAVHDGAFGMMVALRDGQIVRVPIADAVRTPKTLDLDLVEIASALTG